ncbi:DUF2637 domain-containing protein [Streptomyces violascens]|uniref:DUF2637 domain-containing protein n=1 Tax=Streptomyces violascens TaxID=67381 RepID=UPI001E55BFEB|nr:DUF2637 domain-containing protein [Streptomyces violascens]
MIVGVVVGGAVVIAGIGFAGSYAAVRDLAIRKGFGAFAHVFPLGVDSGILVLLSLDLLLTWLRMPFPMLRQTAWLLTGATIAFNGAAAWPDPLGVGMHAVIPVLFVVTVEAARHAVGRLANITAGRHIEPVRLIRWLLSPLPTFKLWRRMKLWELRSYERVITLEQERLVYQARLRSRFGRAWRRKAPVEARLPLQLTRYGVPLSAGRDLVSAPSPSLEGNLLETHVADALAITSAADDVLPDVPSMNVSVQAVNVRAGADVNSGDGEAPTQWTVTVNSAAERELGTVNPGGGSSVNSPVHAPADAPVNGSRHGSSRLPVNQSASGADSRMKPFTPAVNGLTVNCVNSVNRLLTGTVNWFTPIVKPREFTREPMAVNRRHWSVNRSVKLTVNSAADCESGGVNAPLGTVNPVPDETVNADDDKREQDGVNGRTVNSRRTPNVHAAKMQTLPPTSVHASVGAPSPEQAERAAAAAAWFEAKKKNPALQQKEFAESLNRSPAWVTKVLKEARKSRGPADD